MNTPNYFALVENSRFFRLYAEPIVKNDLFPVVNLYRSWPDKANNWANAVFTGSLLEADLDELIANLLHLREDVRAVRKQIEARKTEETDAFSKQLKKAIDDGRRTPLLATPTGLLGRKPLQNLHLDAPCGPVVPSYANFGPSERGDDGGASRVGGNPFVLPSMRKRQEGDAIRTCVSAKRPAVSHEAEADWCETTIDLCGDDKDE